MSLSVIVGFTGGPELAASMATAMAGSNSPEHDRSTFKASGQVDVNFIIRQHPRYQDSELTFRSSTVGSVGSTIGDALELSSSLACLCGLLLGRCVWVEYIDLGAFILRVLEVVHKSVPRNWLSHIVGSNSQKCAGVGGEENDNVLAGPLV